jgi:transposase-like protein
MPDHRRASRTDLPSCPRCKATMSEVVTIAPRDREPGLIAYECPSCGHLSSELVAAKGS